MDWSTPYTGWIDTVRSQVLANTFGAWSVVVYPPGANIPADWPGDVTGAALRLDYYLNKTETLVPANNQSFGLPTFWVFT